MGSCKNSMDDKRIQRNLEAILKEMGIVNIPVRLDRPRDANHGDLATSVALSLASQLQRSPRHIAEEISSRLNQEDLGIETIEIAGPGFLNFKLSGDKLSSGLRNIVLTDESYGKSGAGSDEVIMVEFVSANPTGPLHLGHGRQAALGDAIANLLEWTGWSVSREYYYNDAGTQIERLAKSVWARYQQEIGEEAEIPEGGYSGEYISEIAKEFGDVYGDRFRGDESIEVMAKMREAAVGGIGSAQDSD